MMAKKLIMTALAVFAVAFGFVVRSSAGTEVIDAYKNPVPAYNYAPLPPPRPIYYAPPPRVNVLIFPAYGYCGPRFVGVHRFQDRRVCLRPRHWN